LRYRNDEADEVELPAGVLADQTRFGRGDRKPVERQASRELIEQPSRLSCLRRRVHWYFHNVSGAVGQDKPHRHAAITAQEKSR
jgi:hypothetical protein